MSLPFQKPGDFDVLPMCPHEATGRVCLEPSFPLPIGGRLVCALGHRWEAIPHADQRKVADPIGDLWRDADAQIERWVRRILEVP